MFGDYDEDLNDDRQRCIHGTFVGSWWGPDYLCGKCEMGLTELRPIVRTDYMVVIAASNDKTGEIIDQSDVFGTLNRAQASLSSWIVVLDTLHHNGFTGSVSLSVRNVESMEWCEPESGDEPERDWDDEILL